MRTAAWEVAPQIALRDCSKVVLGEGQYIRFWWRGNSIPLSSHFTKGFFASHEDLMSPWRDWIQFNSIQSLSCVWLFMTSWTAAHQASLSITHAWSFLKFVSIELVMPSNHLILCRPLLLLTSVFSAPRSLTVSQFFASGKQRIRASASTSILPMINQHWFPLGLTGLISLQSKGLSRVFSNTTVQKHQFFSTQFSLWSNSHIHTWPLEKP